jgi:proline iminopeptidase
MEPLSELADERLVVFYDQLGAGKSDHPDDMSLWLNDRFVDELSRVIDAVAPGHVHLLGHSWGTIYATEYALRQPAGLVSLILASPCISVPRYAAAAEVLRAALPAEVQAVIDRHEAAGTTDSEEYQAAGMAFYKRHVCRLDPWPDAVIRTFSQLNQTIYAHMQGPSEFTITGIHKDYDITPRLAEIRVPTLFTCGRHDEMRPEDVGWYQRQLPGSELAVFEQSSHTPHLEEPQRYLQVVRDFLHRTEAR